MSNKCRGYYTIKGEGTEALVKELNKRANRHDTGLQNSKEQPTIAVMCDITSMLTGEKLRDITETVYLSGWGEQWPLVIKDGQAEFWAETLSSPPVDALTTLSELYPVEITLSYSLQRYNWEDGKTLTFHEGKVVQVIDDETGEEVLSCQEIFDRRYSASEQAAFTPEERDELLEQIGRDQGVRGI